MPANALLPLIVYGRNAGIVDRDRVAVSGGSHGGFLTGNLLGRHAERFRAGLARNPVMDLSLMIHVSDIPDWCYVEAYGVQVRSRSPPPFPFSLGGGRTLGSVTPTQVTAALELEITSETSFKSQCWPSELHEVGQI